STASNAPVNKLSPSPRPCVYVGVGLPVPYRYRFVSGSYTPGIQGAPPPCFAASRLDQVSRPGSPAFCGVEYRIHSTAPVRGLSDFMNAGRSIPSPPVPISTWPLIGIGAPDVKYRMSNGAISCRQTSLP